MTFHIITLFPESLDSYINSSIIGRAFRDKKIKIKFYNPRDFTKDKWRRIDHRPYGGGPGMVIEAEAVVKAVEKAIKNSTPPLTPPLVKGRGKRGEVASKIINHKSRIMILWLSPGGKQFDNKLAERMSKEVNHLIIICGRYEGIDARVKKILKLETRNSKFIDLSIGPYVVTGGELGAMVILDTVSRRIPGVLGKIESVEENRISSPNVYTRPEVFVHKGKKYRVPKVLLSGNHAKITEWRSRK